MITEQDSHKSYIALLQTLEERASQYDFDPRYLADGTIISTGGNYKVLENQKTGEAILVAANDVDHLKPADGGSIAALPEKLRIVNRYKKLPRIRSDIRGDILKDRPRWSQFMLHYGNLFEVPVADKDHVHFKNDFASYAAIPVKGKGGETRYEVFAYFNARHLAEHSENPNIVEKFLYRAQNIQSRGLHLGRVNGTRDDVEVFIHKDFCKRFARVLESQNSLAPDDFSLDPSHFVSMLIKNEVDSLHVKKKWTFEEGFDLFHAVATFDFKEALFDLVLFGWKAFAHFRKARGKIMEALLPKSYSGFSQQHFPAAEVSDWRMLTAHEAHVHPDEAPLYDTVADAWSMQDILTAVNSAKPCIIKDAGNGVIGVQEPNGTKLYYGKNSEVYVAYSPAHKLDPIPGCDPDDFIVPEKLKSLFTEAGKVTCLHFAHPDRPNLFHANENIEIREEAVRYTLQKTYLSVDQAYTRIASFSGYQAEILKSHDRVGMPVFAPAPRNRRYAPKPAAGEPGMPTAA